MAFTQASNSTPVRGIDAGDVPCRQPVLPGWTMQHTSSVGTVSLPSRIRNHPPAILLLLYAAYAAGYIYRTSFVVNGRRYFCLFDDAMISMRYAAHLAGGEGLLWNAGGERVEGITNPLWTMMMAACHLLPVEPRFMSLVVQLVGALLLAANLVAVWRIAALLSNGSRAAGIAAVVLTAFYLPLNTWGLQGMEVSALALLVTLAMEHALRALHDVRFTAVPFVLLGVATMIRLDAAVPFVLMTIYLAWNDVVHRRRYLRTGLLMLVCWVVLQTGLRCWYYGELLPNTYYLKMTGVPLLVRVTRGAYTLAKFIVTMNPLLAAAPVLLALKRRDYRLWLPLLLVAAQMCYSVYVGGDAWEWWGGSNRYISIAMPGFMIALALALVRTAEGLKRWIAEAGIGLERLKRGVTPALVATVVLMLNSIHGHQALGEMFLLAPPLHHADNVLNVERAELLARVTTSDAVIATCTAGTLPYFLDRPMVDILGKNDKTVARETAHLDSGLVRFIRVTPGHQKWDYAHSIGDLHPDIVVDLWGDGGDAGTYLQEYLTVRVCGLDLHVRRNSPRICWALVRPVTAERGYVLAAGADR